MRANDAYPPLADVDVRVLNYGVEVASGSTDASGWVELSYEAVDAAPTSGRGTQPWVTLRFKRPGFEPLDLAFTPFDFAETRNRHFLTRGVTLRRAS